jgi:hypothetical protein
MWIIIYRPHNVLNCDTQYIGPFETYDEAEEGLEALPRLPIWETDGPGETSNRGVKFIEALSVPTRRDQMLGARPKAVLADDMFRHYWDETL